jgi:hypothetical protein
MLGGLVLLALLSLFAIYFWNSMVRGRIGPTPLPAFTRIADGRVIVEGKGWGGFNIGATRAELIQALGQPDSDSDNHWMKWKQAHVHCLVDDASGAFELRFDEGFPGLTTAGIGIGSPLKDALAAYGEPSSQENVRSAKKLLWNSKGILIWFDEDRAAEIVVFQKTSARTGSDAANPLVGITGTPARSWQYQIAEGKGWNGFKLGATRAELIKALGQPDSDSDNRWMKWKQAHVHCLIDDAHDAFELRFDEGFPGLTTAGIGIGSPLKDALAAYGEPSSQENVGSAKKLLWNSKGILIWFHEDRAAQIVVFQKPDQPSTLTPSAGLVELKLKWPPGKHYVVDFDFKQNAAYLLRGRTNTIKEDFTMGNQFGRTVLQETPDGGHEMELEFLSARMGIKMGDQTILDYNSANQSAADQTNEVAAVFGKIVGSKIRYFLNASNDAECLEGVGELVQRIKSVPQADPLAGDIKNIYSAAFFEALTNASPFLPRQAVQPGDTWSSHFEHPVTNWGIEVWDYKVVFLNWEMHENHNCARLELQGIMKVKPDPNSKRDETTYHPRDGIAEGVAWFDPELGQIIETDIKNDVNVDKKTPVNPNGTPGAAEQMQTITTQRHQVCTIKLE